jgi:hypothetical protein
MRLPQLFNGPIEVGLRALTLLVETFPRGLDLQRLVTLDHMLVHSGDVPGGPQSLHPPSPLRAGEVAVRRTLVESGLRLYMARDLISRSLVQEGIIYSAVDGAAGFIDVLRSPYVDSLRERARWVCDSTGSLPDEKLGELAAAVLGRWRVEFIPLGWNEDVL